MSPEFNLFHQVTATILLKFETKEKKESSRQTSINFGCIFQCFSFIFPRTKPASNFLFLVIMYSSWTSKLEFVSTCFQDWFFQLCFAASLDFKPKTNKQGESTGKKSRTNTQENLKSIQATENGLQKRGCSTRFACSKASHRTNKRREHDYTLLIN